MKINKQLSTMNRFIIIYYRAKFNNMQCIKIFYCFIVQFQKYLLENNK